MGYRREKTTIEPALQAGKQGLFDIGKIDCHAPQESGLAMTD
jgi:hypothetical protein